MDLVLLVATLIGALLVGGIGVLLVFVAGYMLLVGLLWEKVLRRALRAFVACYRAVTGRSKPRAGSVRRGEHGSAWHLPSPGNTLAAAWRRKSWKRNVIRDARPPRPFVFGRAEEGHLYDSVLPYAEFVPTQPLVPVRTSFTCPQCGAVSHHPRDIKEGYCGRCHDYTGGFGGWPRHRLEHWPASLQIQELGGIIVDDLVVEQPAETATSTDTVGTDLYARLFEYQEGRRKAIKAMDPDGDIPRVPIDEMAWVFKLVDKAKQTSVAEYLCVDLVDGGYSVRRNRAGTHTTYLFALARGVWYLMWAPNDTPNVADRTWSYDWGPDNEPPFRRAMLAAIDWDGSADTEPTGYTERKA